MVDIVSFVHGDKWNIYGWDASVGIRVSDQKTVARIVSLMEFMTGSVFGVANCFCAGHLLRRVFMHSDTNKKKKSVRGPQHNVTVRRVFYIMLAEIKRGSLVLTARLALSFVCTAGVLW